MASRIISVRELVLHGRLGGVGPGADLDAVQQALGPCRSRHDDDQLILLSYGPYEVHLWRGEVFCIQNDSLQYVNGLAFENEVVAVAPWCLSSGLHLQGLASVLEGEGRRFDIGQKHDFLTIQVHGGAEVGFLRSGLLAYVTVTTWR